MGFEYNSLAINAILKVKSRWISLKTGHLTEIVKNDFNGISTYSLYIKDVKQKPDKLYEIDQYSRLIIYHEPNKIKVSATVNSEEILDQVKKIVKPLKSIVSSSIIENYTKRF